MYLQWAVDQDHAALRELIAKMPLPILFGFLPIIEKGYADPGNDDGTEETNVVIRRLAIVKYGEMLLARDEDERKQ